MTTTWPAWKVLTTVTVTVLPTSARAVGLTVVLAGTASLVLSWRLLVGAAIAEAMLVVYDPPPSE